MVLASGAACFAQNDRAPDSLQRDITKAKNEGRLLDAENLLRDGIRKLEEDNPQNPQIAIYLKELAPLVARTEGEAAYLPLLQRAYEIDRAAFGGSDLRVANDLGLLAASSNRTGNRQDAEREFDEAVGIVRSKEADLRWNEGAGLAASIIGGAARFYIEEERWVDAEVLMPEEVKLCNMIPGEFHDGFGLCSRIEETMAEIYRGEGKAPQVQERRALTNFPPELTALNETAQKYVNDGLYPSAEETYEQAIKLAKKMDSDRGHYGQLRRVEIDQLGQLFEREGFKDRAEKSYKDALEIGEQEARSQSGRPTFAESLFPVNLIYLYRHEGRLQDADAVVQGVLEFQITSLGPRHRVIVDTLTELADIREQEGQKDPTKLADAKATYERAVAMQEANVGPNDASLINLLQKYASLLSRLNEDAKAAEVRARIDSLQAVQRKAGK
ncbi:MAG TPA: tetratricopeptide repeat protein [Verrucomicrobiae bacterium]|nr:tetratricopeptide repeat protein [Verrucomicrobiae bacterium]